MGDNSGQVDFTRCRSGQNGGGGGIAPEKAPLM
jgi:hypothetical protein